MHRLCILLVKCGVSEIDLCLETITEDEMANWDFSHHRISRKFARFRSVLIITINYNKYLVPMLVGKHSFS